MEISARNQLKGTVKSIKQGGVMTEVIIALAGGQSITSVVTNDASEALNLREGDSVVAVVKSTEVMVAKE